METEESFRVSVINCNIIITERLETFYSTIYMYLKDCSDTNYLCELKVLKLNSFSHKGTFNKSSKVNLSHRKAA